MISALTLVKKRSAHLRNLLSGLSAGARVPDEVVVVLMDESDPEHEIDVPGLRCRYVRMNSNDLPLARARNLAARVARHEDLVFLDVDCIPSTRLISAYEEVLMERDALFMGPVQYLQAPVDSVDQTELELRSQPHPDRIPPGERPVSACTRYELFWSLSFALHKSTWNRLGGFDGRFNGYGAEDTDFAYTARRDGVPLLWVRDALAFHQCHATYDPPLQHFDAIVENARRFWEKWGGWPMEGWLTSFAEMGLVAWTPGGDGIEILRGPHPLEIEAAKLGEANR